MSAGLGTDHFGIDDADLRNLTPEKARDILVDCFYHAQKETFERVKKDLGARASQEDVRKSVVQAIRLSFREAGHAFDHPTREGLEDAVQVLARKAGSWGTPEDIISHHMREIDRLLDALAHGK